MTRVGVFGGSFNPIHLAHLILAERVRCERALDRILFVPAGRPPHKPQTPLAPAADRLRMVELAIEGNPAFEAVPLELECEEPSYTLLTVRRLREQLGPRAALFLILGSDSVRDIPTWWRADELVQEADIIAVERPGCPLEAAIGEPAGRYGRGWAGRVKELAVRAPLLAISATEVRERVRRGLSIRYLVPEPVRQYILAHGLYVETG
jgi:nicotinate-nucleotide adenylyltransferase